MSSRIPKTQDGTQRLFAIGDVMDDGSVFAGRTPDGTQRLFAMPADLGLVLTFNEAAKRVAQLNTDKTLGHDDWQIPSLEQLELLYERQNNGALKGIFTKEPGRGDEYPDCYWSSTEDREDPSFMWNLRFSDGDLGSTDKDHYRMSCRPVRLVPVNKPGSAP